MVNKEEFTAFLNSGKKEKEESDNEDNEELKDDLVAPSEVPEIEIKPVPLATSPYIKILSVLTCYYR